MRADIYNITIFNEYFNDVTKRMFNKAEVASLSLVERFT